MYYVYGTSTCHFCEKAKALLKLRDLEFIYVNIEDPVARETLEQKIGSFRTVPQIVHNGAHIGGYTELQQHLREQK